jgi:hypothetical protein
MTKEPQSLEHVLVVAGFSGAGKSTFMDQLAAGQLSPQISELLPGGSREWPQTHGTEGDLRVAVSVPPQSARRLVLHYDLLRPARNGLANYETDPALDVLAHAERISVVLIEMSRARLSAQVSRREFGGQSRFQTGLNILRWRLARGLSASLSLLKGAAERLPAAIGKPCTRFLGSKRKEWKTLRKTIRKGQRKMWDLTFYRHAQGVDLWTSRWLAYVHRMKAAGQVGNSLTLQPSSDVYTEMPEWRLAHHAAT